MITLPNAISVFRLVASPFVFLLAYRDMFLESAVLFLFLAVSDAVDGALARLMKAQTTLGKILDPLADKSLLLFGLASITFHTDVRSSYVLFKLLMMRDILLVGGSLFLRRFGFVPEPSPLGKATTFFLSVTVSMGFLANLSPEGLVLSLFRWSQSISLALIVLSGIDYTAKGINFLLGKFIMERR